MRAGNRARPRPTRPGDAAASSPFSPSPRCQGKHVKLLEWSPAQVPIPRMSSVRARRSSVPGMRLGVLDVGSNTVHLLVMDAHPGARPLPAYSHKAELRLAELLDEGGAISADGVDRLVA